MYPASQEREANIVAFMMDKEFDMSEVLLVCLTHDQGLFGGYCLCCIMGRRTRLMIDRRRGIWRG